MKLVIEKNIDISYLMRNLESAFPDYKLKKAPLNKNTIRVINGMDQVVVGQSKEKLICVGNINMLDLRILIPFIILLALFVIGGIAFVFIMMYARKQQYKAMENEIGEYITKNII